MKNTTQLISGGTARKDLFYRPAQQLNFPKVEKQKMKHKLNHSDYFKEKNEISHDKQKYDKNKKKTNDET